MIKKTCTLKTVKRSLISSAILLELTMGSAIAATINVENTCTLVDAIRSANTDSAQGGCTAGSDADVIQITEANTVLGLSTAAEPSQAVSDTDVGLPVITSDVTIEGNGLTINAYTTTNKFRVFEVFSAPPPYDTRGYPITASLTLRDTTVTGGDDGSDGIGGGLLANYATVNLENTKFTKNVGGVILAVSPNSQIENSVIRDNTATNTQFSSGLQIINSNVTINNTSIVNNRLKLGRYGPLRVSELTQALQRRGITTSGGIGIAMPSNVDITNSTISGNSSIYGGGMTITGYGSSATTGQTSPFNRNFNRGIITPTVNITNSTITDNSALIVGGILTQTSDGELNISGTILSGNKANTDFGRELYSSPSAVVNFDNYNLVGEKSNSGLQNATLGTNDILVQGKTSEILYPLAESNGQFLHPLKVNSPAIDAMPLSCFGLTQDQEQTSRAIDGNGDGSFICDIGSFEKSAEITVNDSPCTLNNAIISANTDSSVGGCVPGVGADVINLQTLSSITITGQVAYAYGAYFGLPTIQSSITLEGNGSTIERDLSAPDFGIVAIQRGGDLLLRNTTVTQGSGPIAGILSAYANVSLQSSTITNMAGLSFISYFAAKSLLENSTISNNTLASYTGNGSFYNDTVKVKGSVFTGNTANLGAGLDLRGNAYTSIKNSTISSNENSSVSSLILLGSAIIDGLTVTGNTATQASGGAYIRANSTQNEIITLSNSIFSGNTLTMTGSIRGPIENSNEILNVDSGGLISNNNIFGQDSVSGVVGVNIDGNSLIPATPTSGVIGPLQNNGGSTLSHQPVVGSIAIDSGSQNCQLKVDQINNLRPFDGDDDGDSTCDIGSIEFGSFDADDIIFADGFDPIFVD